MKLALVLLVSLMSLDCVAQTPVQSQPSSSEPVIQDLVEEPHHKLVVQNDTIRVFHLKLQANEVTSPHRHKGFYMYLSVTPATIGNEVRGRQTVRTALEPGEVHTSKGGFNVAERNGSSTPVELIVIEWLKPNTESFATPLGGFRYHDAALGELFEAGGVRAYTMTIAAEGRTEPHQENYSRLIVAVSDLTLRESVSGEKPRILELKAGEVKWLPRGVTHATTNVGTKPATFVTFEFSATGS